MTSVQTNNNINTFSGKTKKEHNTGRNILGVVGGTATGFALFQASKLPMKSYNKTMLAKCDEFSPEENDQLVAEANRMVEKSGIKNKGFNGIYLVSESLENLRPVTEAKTQSPIKDTFTPMEKVKKMSLKDLLTKSAKANEISKGGGTLTLSQALSEISKCDLHVISHGSFSDKLLLAALVALTPLASASSLFIGNTQKRNLKDSIMTGCYENFSNRVFTGKSSSLLHEVGHAINKNKNFATRIPKNLKMLSSFVLIPLATLSAIFTKKPKTAKNKTKEQTTMQKVKAFNHKHIGLIVAGLSLPLLTEEAMASIRAAKFANASEVLSKNAKKQHNKNLKLAFGSYLIGTTMIAAITQAVVSVKDAIQTHKHKKNN